MKPLDPMNMPFAHRVLIEASAGTGKTYTLATLYLRALLGLGHQPLVPNQLLVVTFTRAATQELRERIRQRIVELQAQLTELPPPWAQYIQDVAPAKLRLDVAKHWMDQASIYTIHGFCQKVLHEFSVESGQLFQQRFLETAEPLQLDAVFDFWRREVATLEYGEYVQFTQWWPDPESLLKSLKPLYQLAEVHIHSLDKEVNASTRLLFERWLGFREQWQRTQADLYAWLKQSPSLGKGFQRYLGSRWQALNRVMMQPISALAKRASKTADIHKIQYLYKEALIKASKHSADLEDGLATLPGAEVFDLLQQLWDSLDAVAELVEMKRQSYLLRAYELTQKQIQAVKARKALTGADDLLLRLDRALKGPMGDALAQRIAKRYPLAMIDEFQDTDAIQYRIFSKIYQAPERSLIMIGDPKQAIYKFRGADIFTYLKASQQAQEYRFTLAHNYRSRPDVVEAVNALFSYHPNPFVFQGIEYHQVSSALQNVAQPHNKPQAIDPQVGMGWVKLPAGEFTTKAAAFTWMAERFAEHIQRWLQPESCTMQQEPSAYHDHSAYHERPLSDQRLVKGGDIAVLVRDRNEARWIQQALRAKGLRSVFLSRDNLYHTQEAIQLFFWLEAMAHPDQEHRVRAALATELMGLTPDALEQLFVDERIWEQEWTHFRRYQQKWLREGILSALTYLIHHRGLPEKWLQDTHRGERRLTNVLHLAEHLQSQAPYVQGQQGLLDWFAQALNCEQAAADHQLLRLESDQDLIQILTIHRSKGLEYPIVCLPFVWYATAAKEPIYHQSDLGLVYDLAASRQALSAAEEERLAEDVRLLYVAMTRAKAFTLVGFGQLKRGSPGLSALHYLLNPAGAASAALGLEALLSERPDMAVLETVDEKASDLKAPDMKAPDEAIDGIDSCDHAVPPRQAKTFHGRIINDWAVTSYSALTRTLDVGHEVQRLEEYLALKNDDEEVVATALGFPKGARAGNCLHALLEALMDTSQYQQGERQLLTEQHIQTLLQQHGFDLSWALKLQQWLADILAFKLVHEDSKPCQLQALTANQALVEMQFYMAIERLEPRQFLNLLDHYPILTLNKPSLRLPNLQGLIKGYIDLVFEWQGRFYVLDYKSNYLGVKVEHYQGVSLQTAMASHRYDIQLVLYSLALHRYLKQRLPNYDYQQHFGGAHYVFLRGMALGEGHFFSKPAQALIEGLDQGLGPSHE
jgi:exodeoxyribonuclease V beta subunit